MTNPEKAPVPDEPEIQLDSLNCDICEPTDVVIDTTVRPMRESLRKGLNLPHTGDGSHELPNNSPQ